MRCAVASYCSHVFRNAFRTLSVQPFYVAYPQDHLVMYKTKQVVYGNLRLYTATICKLSTAVYPSNRARTATKLRQNTVQTIPNTSFFDVEKKISTKFSDRKISFSLILWGFGGAGGKRTSKSSSTSNFAPDTPVLRSVRSKIVKKRVVPGLRQPYRHVWCRIWALAVAFDLLGGGVAWIPTHIKW